MNINSATQQELDARAAEDETPDGAAILSKVYSFIGRFVVYPSKHAQVAHALWILHAHLMDRWDSTPRLAFLSAEPASGKTRALEVTELLVRNPVSAVNVSPAYLFRKVGSEEGVTILFDEIDTVFGPKAKENEELRGLLNAGHRRGAKAGRCVVKGKEIVTEEIPAYAAVALAGLGWLPETILSRSVIIRMRRRHEGECVQHFRHRIHGVEGHRICSSIDAWARANEADIRWPDLPPEIQDRDADVWESLIAIADVVNGDWPARARAAAIALISEAKDREPSLGIRLLWDLQIVFVNEEMTSKAILAALHAIEESPWKDIKGKPLDDRGLANRLRHYGIKPNTIRIGNATPRGYRRADFLDIWKRHPPPSAEKSATNETGATRIERTRKSVSDEMLDVSDGAQRKADAQAEKGGEIKAVSDVAAVVDFPAKEGTCRCDQCGQPSTPVDPLNIWNWPGSPDGVWLHPRCEGTWHDSQGWSERPPVFEGTRKGLN